LDKLQALERISDQVKLLPQIDTISQQELEDWFNQYLGGAPNQKSKLQEMISALGGGQEWNRMLVEKELEGIVHEKLKDQCNR